MKCVINVDTKNPYVAAGGEYLFKVDELNTTLDEDTVRRLAQTEQQIKQLYQDGFRDGNAFGGKEAWDAAKTIVFSREQDLRKVFGTSLITEIFMNYSPHDAAEKIRAYKNGRNDPKRSIEQDLDTLMTSTGMTIEEIAERLKRMAR